MDTESKESFIEKNLWWLLLIIGLISLSVYFWQFHGVLANESDKWDHFGSYIGGIFSGMAFLALIAEMRTNKKREKRQEERYQGQIDDLKREKKEQDKRWAKEDFERTFFMMLSQFNKKLSSLEESDINDIYDSIAIDYSSDFYTIRNNAEEKNKYPDINMLFINLYRILKFTDESHFKTNKKRVYTNILRSYLSRKFLVILGFHLLYRDSSYDKYITYIERYNIFEHIGLKYLEIKFLKSKFPYSGHGAKLVYNRNFQICIDNIIKEKGRPSNKTVDPNTKYIINEQLKFNEFIEKRKKGISFKFENDNHYSNYDFIFIHLITNFRPEAFSNSLEYRDTTKTYDLCISKIKEIYF